MTENSKTMVGYANSLFVSPVEMKPRGRHSRAGVAVTAHQGPSLLVPPSSAQGFPSMVQVGGPN